MRFRKPSHAVPRQLSRFALVAIAAWGVVVSAAPAVTNFPAPAEIAGTITRFYTMNAHVRPLLIWMTREDVGGARIRWNSAQGADKNLDLLIGSDPDHAPLGVNRWGFISEQTAGDTAQLTGVMTEADEQSIDQARSNIAPPSAGEQVFLSVKTTVRNSEATSATSRLVLGSNVTFRDYATLLNRVASATPATEQRMRLDPGTEPGFLVALKGLVHATVEGWQRTRRVAPPASSKREYVYIGKIYDLWLRQATLVTDASVAGRVYGTAIDAQFQVRNRKTGDVSEFQMMFAAAGPDAETPLRIVYRPRWWVELELLLANPASPKGVFAMRQ